MAQQDARGPQKDAEKRKSRVIINNVLYNITLGSLVCRWPG